MASINGKRVVFTGELESMTRTEAQAKAKALGAIVGSAVNAETDLLVAGPGAGSKLAAALKHGVKVLNEKQWLKIAGGGSKAAPAKVAKTSAKKAAKKAAVSAGKKAAGKKTAKSAATKSPKKKATQSASKKAAAKTTSNTTAKSTAAAPAADPSRLWTLLSEPDLASINQGLELAAALPGEIDGLLKGCSVLKNGTIKRSKRFGSDDGESQEFLNLALLGLLSLAPDRSAAAKLRKSVTKIDMQVADVPRLAGFTALESLDLSSYANEPSEAPRATDLSRFGAMPKLKLIQLSLSWLTSLEGLDAPNLKQAICSSCEALTDVSSLSGLPVLTNLDLRGCRELTDLGPLSGLKSLKSLRLTSCEKLTDLKPLSDLKALKSLDMRNCSTLTDLKPLSGLKSLKSLDLGGRSSLPNMSPLSGLKALTSLSLFDCGSLTDLAPLARLKALTSLDLSFCRSLTDLGPLSGLKALTSLSLGWCKKLNDLGPLAGLEALTSLSLESCEKLTDLAPLARLKALTSLRLSDCEGLPKRLRAYDTYSGESVQALLKALRGTSMIELPRREAGRVAAGIRRGGGRLLIGGVVTEISHALGTVVDSRGRERDAFMVEEGTSEVYAVFSMPEQAAESVEAIVAIGRGANLLGYKWEGLESTEGKGGFGPFCARTKRRISGKFHDGGDIKVIKLTRDGDPDVEFESPDGTREPIETDEALSLLKALAAESGGKAPRKAAKRKAQRKSSKKAAKATKKTSKQSSKKTANTTKKTSKKRSPRR